MAELTIEQKRAMAMAAARLRLQQGQGGSPLSTAAPAPHAPEGKGVLRTIDDAVRGAADMLTFGTADEISAKLGEWTGIGSAGGDYDTNLAAERARDADGGAARFAGQLAGAVALPGAAAKGVVSAAAQGAGMGAAYGFGSGEGGAIDRTKNAVAGAITGGAVGGAVRAGANALGNRAARASIPENAEIRRTATAAYNKAEAAGVTIRPEGMQRLAQAITADLADFGYDPALQPGIATVINRIQTLSDKNVTLKGVDVVRKVAGNVAKNYDNPSQQALAAKVIDHIDDFIDTLPEQEILTGNAQAGAAAMREARQLWGRVRRSEAVDTAAERADLRAASTGSGGNVDNATRQNVRRLVENPRGMSEAERAAAERVVRGTKVQNTLRLVGKLSPQGNGLMAALGVGGAMANPVLGIPSLVGLGAKALADRGTQKNLARLSELIRSGGMTVEELAQMARSGQIAIPGVGRAEALEQSLRPSLSSLGAMAADRVRN